MFEGGFDEEVVLENKIVMERERDWTVKSFIEKIQRKEGLSCDSKGAVRYTVRVDGSCDAEACENGRSAGLRPDQGRPNKPVHREKPL